MSELERAMFYLVDIFRSYACKDGDDHHLNRTEMRDMFRSECAKMLEECWDVQRVAEIMAGMDTDSDGKVNFEEFVSMAAKLVMCSSSYFISGMVREPLIRARTIPKCGNP